MSNAELNSQSYKIAGRVPALEAKVAELEAKLVGIPWSQIGAGTAGPGYEIRPNESFYRWDNNNFYINAIVRTSSTSGTQGNILFTFTNPTGKHARSSYLPCVISQTVPMPFDVTKLAGYASAYFEPVNAAPGEPMTFQCGFWGNISSWAMISVTIPLWES